MVELVLGQPALEEGAGVDAGRRVALEEDLVAARLGVLAPEEVVEADLVQAGRAERTSRGGRRCPENRLLARRTIATAFQRTIRRMRSSISSSPGKSAPARGRSC